MSKLISVEHRIEIVIERIRNDHPDWLCRRGCDDCCRRLAESPRMTLTEWQRLREGLLELDDSVRADIFEAIEQAADQEGFVVCPMLDQTEGACRVYPCRPIACRSYGYYAQRGIGLYCKKIEAEVEGGQLDQVIWGNQDAIDQALRSEGPLKSLSEWLHDPHHGVL